MHEQARLRLIINSTNKLQNGLNYHVELASLSGIVSFLFSLISPKTAAGLQSAINDQDEEKLQVTLKKLIRKAKRSFRRQMALVKRKSKEKSAESVDTQSDTKYIWYVYTGPDKVYLTAARNPLRLISGKRFGLRKGEKGRFMFYRFGMRKEIPVDVREVKSMISKATKTRKDKVK